MYTCIASIGKMSISIKPCVTNQQINSIIPYNNVDNEYIYYALQKETDYIKSTQSTNTLPIINKTEFSKFNISTPSLPEQTRIANFLTAVDDKITQLKKKKRLLEQYKKGVMQQIFSQKLRFKDENGVDFAEWEEKKLGEILIKNSKKNKNQEYKLVQSVSNKYGFVNQTDYFEDRVVASKDLSNYYVIQKGNFAYNPSRIDVGSLAYKSDNNISVISPLYISFSAKKDFLKDIFLLYWFSTELFTKQMDSSFEGSVRNTLSYESLTKIEIVIPSLPEQTKIANFLSAIDDKINHCGKQIEKMEGWKKGLLQQMFV
jgi:type I restriction enzyme, S subunit